MSEKPCYLYAIATVHGGELCSPVKIGISSKPQSRIRELQTGSAHKLAFALLLMLDDRQFAKTVEQNCLQFLSDYGLSGEWVDMHPLEVVGELVAEVICVSGHRVTPKLTAYDAVVQ